MKSLNEKELLLSRKDINDFNIIIKNTQDSIKEKIGQNSKMPKIVLIGMTGSGKSSLSCSLSNQELIIQATGKKTKLIGNGVFFGCAPGTTEPSIISDPKSNILFCDCPGFEDSRGYLQEIINAFAIESIFDSNGNDTRVKVLLVISEHEFESRSGDAMISSFKRLETMLPKYYKETDKIGFVITKGPIDWSGIDYFSDINDGGADPLVEKWINFFKENLQNIFTFPKATVKDIGKQYDFEDRERLLEFIQKDYILNPVHEISISEIAFLQMKQVRLIHATDVLDKVNKICEKIHEQFEKEKTSNELNKWIDIMHELLHKNINNAKEFAIVIKELIPNSEQYENDFKSLEEFELFDHFLDKIIYKDEKSSCLKDAIRVWCQKSVIDISKLHTNMIKNEFNEKEMARQKKLLEEKERMNSDQIRKFTELEQMINNLNNDHSRRLKEQEEENERRRKQEIEDLKQSYESGNAILKNDFQAQLKEIETRHSKEKERYEIAIKDKDREIEELKENQKNDDCLLI